MTLHTYCTWEISEVENAELNPWDAKILVSRGEASTEVMIFRPRSTRRIEVSNEKAEKLLASWHESLTRSGYKVELQQL
jgi:hypothetical protein